MLTCGGYSSWGRFSARICSSRPSICGTKDGSSITCEHNRQSSRQDFPAPAQKPLSAFTNPLPSPGQGKAMSTPAGSATAPGHSCHGPGGLAGALAGLVPCPHTQGTATSSCHPCHGRCSCLARPREAGPDQTHPKVHLGDEPGQQRREEGFGQDAVTSQPQRDEQSHCPVEEPGSELTSHGTFRINWLIGTAGCAQERRKDGSLCRHRPEEKSPVPCPLSPPDPGPGHC